MKQARTLLFFATLICFYSALIVVPASLRAQPETFSHQDSLRGSLNAERNWWNVLHYALQVTPNYAGKTIRGSNQIVFRVERAAQMMQIDFQEPMQLRKVTWNKQSLSYVREGNVFHIRFPEKLAKGSTDSVLLEFDGSPRQARNPPWDGGWIWTTDQQGRPWMSVACQGLGASVWYPCKDYQGDEPDQGASLQITVPDTLVAVGNGRLLSVTKDRKTRLASYTWKVVNPINNYNIIPYIGKYVNWTETLQGEKGNLDCSYWVLDYDLARAREQFKQAPIMLHCFEYWFGPYPFYEDGYKLVEAPHLGMEHQSAVAYGNKFQNGYLGRDLSGTGWGLKWDFIIVHESGHEWFGNNITSKDLADMWIHEGFTNYSETIFTSCQYGKEAGDDYVIGTRRLIRNNKPIIAHYGVNEEGSGDMYYKGGNMLHTIRQVIDNDSLFRDILRGLNHHFYHKTVTTAAVEQYISRRSGRNFGPVFDEYLRTTLIPVLDYYIRNGELRYRWTQVVTGFDMPVKVYLDGKARWLRPTRDWQTLRLTEPVTELKADRNFYIRTEKQEG